MFFIGYEFYIVNTYISCRFGNLVNIRNIIGIVLFRVRLKAESKDTEKNWQEDQGMVHSKQRNKEEDLTIKIQWII